MEYTCKTYVEFLSSGTFFDESSVKEVRKRDVSKIKVPKGVLFFRFFDILSAVVYANDKKIRLRSGRTNVSPNYFYGGKIYTIQEIKRDFPKKTRLIREMRDERKKAICCQTGEWVLANKTDIIIEGNRIDSCPSRKE